MILRVDGLTVDFRRQGGRGVVRALDGVAFNLARGESLSVIGESGSGKTTLLRCISAHVAPDAGSVSLFGVDLGGADRSSLVALRRRCALVPQDPYGALPPSLTVLEAVMEPWLLVRGGRREGEARARSLLEELGLGEELLSSKVRLSLSGGQRQRVAVARALILEPELLLCDEPTSMQDASTRGEVLEMLCRRQRAGMSMLFVTHDLFLARRAAARGIVLHRGLLVEEGATGGFLESPRHPYTRALASALPRLSPLLDGSG